MPDNQEHLYFVACLLVNARSMQVAQRLVDEHFPPINDGIQELIGYARSIKAEYDEKEASGQFAQAAFYHNVIQESMAVIEKLSDGVDSMNEMEQREALLQVLHLKRQIEKANEELALIELSMAKQHDN